MQPTPRNAAVWGALLLFSALTTGCGGNGSVSPLVGQGPLSWAVATGGSELSGAIQSLDFYPHAITVHAGDTITFTNPTTIPHTVSIPPAGQNPPAGPPNPAPVGGTVFDNSTYISSGFLANGKSYSVTFTTPGTYAYFCVVHQPEMSGSIVVIPATAPLPMTGDQYAAVAAKDVAIDLAAGLASIQNFPYLPGGTHLAAGISPGALGTAPSQPTVLRFLDDKTMNANITIAVGTTVTWTNQSNNVPHTVTFPIAGQGPPTGSPDLPPAGGSTYDGTALTNSGRMPPGKSYSLTFTKAGTYTYYCLFHDGPTGMIGTVTVQ